MTKMLFRCLCLISLLLIISCSSNGGCDPDPVGPEKFTTTTTTTSIGYSTTTYIPNYTTSYRSTTTYNTSSYTSSSSTTSVGYSTTTYRSSSSSSSSSTTYRSSSSSSSSTTTTTVLAAPVMSSPGDNGWVSFTPRLSWYSVSGAAGYQWEMSPSSAVDSNGKFTYTSNHYYSGNVNAPSTQVQFTSTIAHDIYYWHVRAKASDNSYGAWSDALSFSVIMPPTLVAPPDNATPVFLQPTIDWNSVSGATRYQWEISPSGAVDSEGKFTYRSNHFYSGTETAPTTQFSFLLQGVIMASDVYHWHVRAMAGDGGYGPWSEIWVFGN